MPAAAPRGRSRRHARCSHAHEDGFPMTIRNHDRLLAPKSVALIGASTQEGSVGLITTRNLLQGGFTGPIWLVNPRHTEIEGHPCYPSIAALPAAPELAVVAT